MKVDEATQEIRVQQRGKAPLTDKLASSYATPVKAAQAPQPITTAHDPIAATFFDGSYTSSSERAQSVPRSFVHGNGRTTHLFEYTLPRWSVLYNITLVALDMLMALIAISILVALDADSFAFLERHSILGNGFVDYPIVVCFSWLAGLGVSHIFERHTMGEGYELYSKIFKATFINFIFLSTYSYLFKLDNPRTLTIGVPILTAVFTVIERWLMRQALQRNRRNGEYNYPSVVVGSPEGLHKTIALLREHKSLGYVPIAICPVASAGNDSKASGSQHLISVPFQPTDDFERGLRVLPLNSHLPQTAKYLKAETMVIADVIDRYSETMRTLSLAVESMGIELAFSSAVADLDGATLHLRNHPTMPVFTARLPQYSLLTKALKRSVDIIGSMLLLILTSPIMAYVALRVKMEDGGPAIYKQTRIGIYGRPFTLYKFRSMTVNADKQDVSLAEATGENHGILFKPKEDPRITPFGHFIRKTSLDEFPQFFNVFKGDMSLVGPRPQQQYEVDQYGTLYSSRLLVKPGITGLWQISGRSDLSQEESEQLDVTYIQNWSLTGDLAILFKTVGAVIRGTGSY